MTPVRATYLAIAGRIRYELQQVSQVVERTVNIWQQSAQPTNDYYVDAVALNLHGVYAGLERIFEAIADGVDQVRPRTANWHQELLRQMAIEIPGIRPPVLSTETRTRLDRYRGFRHVVRNLYTFELDPQQIRTLVEGLQPAMEQVSRELVAFAQFLEHTAGAEETM